MEGFLELEFSYQILIGNCMGRIFFIISAYFFVSNMLFAETLESKFLKLKNSKLSLGEAAKNFVNSIDDDVDVAHSALILENEIDSKIEVNKYLERLDKMVEVIKEMTGESTDPIHRINTIKHYLFSIFKMSYDFSDPFANKRSNRTLSGILDTKKGSCVTMPLLFLVLAQRLNYPIHPVLLPQHMFLRYSAIPKGIYNLEVTSDGDIFRPDSFYKGEEFNLTQIGIDSGAYFKPLSYKEFLFHLFSDSSQYFFFEKENYDHGFKYIQTATFFRRNTANLYMVKARMFDHLRKIAISGGDQYWAKKHYDTAVILVDKAEKLGFTRPDPKLKQEYQVMMNKLEIQRNQKKGMLKL